MPSNINPKDKSNPHDILKPLVYTGPNRAFHKEPAKSATSGLIRSRLKPGDNIHPTFEHVDDAAYTLLRLKGNITPIAQTSKRSSKA